MANQAKVAQIYAELRLSTAKFKAALGEATNETRKLSSEVRRNSEEARGAIALLGEEIGVRLPRHVRGFVAELPGVAKAMSAAFNAIAVFAIINTLVEAGNKIREFVNKTEEAAKKNAEAWSESAKEISGVNTSLETSNAKIADTISKLEHKPGENGIKSALLEASEQADKLGEKLDKDLQKISNVKVSSGLASLFSGGKSDTDKAAGTAALRLQAIIDDYNDTLSRAAESGDTKNYNRVRGEQLSRVAADPQFNQAFNQLSDYLRANQNLVGAHNQNFDNASSAFNIIAGSVRSLNLQQGQELGNQKVASLTNSKDANGALQQEDAKRLKAFEATLEHEKSMYGVSVAQERSYWEAKLKELHAGTGAYNSAMQKFSASAEQLSRQFERIRRSTAGIDNAAPALGIGADRGSDQLASANAKRIEQQAQLNAEWVTAADKLGLLTGTVTAHEAALHQAAAHADEYRIKLDALQEQLKQLQDEDALADVLGGGDENRAKQIQVQSQIDSLQSKSRIQQLTDAQNVLGTTWKGMVDSVFDELIRRSDSTSQQIQQIALHTVDGINGELAKGITGGGKMDFSKVFQSSAQSLAKSGFEKVEGSLLKGFGLGSKRDGSSAANALFVQMAGGTSGIPSVKNFGGVGHSILGMLNDSNRASSLFGGKLFGGGSLLGGFADGGDVKLGGMYRIGERGPETMYLPAGSHIAPNGAGAASSSVHIGQITNADPVHTQMAVMQGIRMARAQSHADMRKVIDRQRRTAH
jgi:hypothetical protein